MTAKMLSDKCDAVEMVPRGVTLPPLPAGASPAAPARDPKRIEMLLGPTNVTNYLDAGPNTPGFEYLVTAWYDPPDTLRDGTPIDDSVAGMKKEKFACVGSQHRDLGCRRNEGNGYRSRDSFGAIRGGMRGRL